MKTTQSTAVPGWGLLVFDLVVLIGAGLFLAIIRPTDGLEAICIVAISFALAHRYHLDVQNTVGQLLSQFVPSLGVASAGVKVLGHVVGAVDQAAAAGASVPAADTQATTPASAGGGGL